MRKQILTPTILLILALLPGMVAQAQTLEVAGNADCEGWSATATLNFPSGVFFADLDYSVVLTDHAGDEVTRFDWAGQVSRYEDPVMIRLYDDSWGLTLDSVYTASIVFHFLGEESNLSLDVICGSVGEEDPVPEPCHHTFRYWRKNPSEWPVDELLLAGEVRSKEELLNLMHAHLRFHPVFSVARHLVAARLNVLNGTDDSIMPTIEAAESFLVDNAENRRGWWRMRREARQLRKTLVRYNKQPCNQFDFLGNSSDEEFGKTFADEPMTFDGVKAMYR